VLGPALFYSLIIIVVSFLPVFLLDAQEGRMFRPLPWTKTLALVFSSLLSITLVPALMPLFVRGRLRPESQNPAARITKAIYLPVLRRRLRHWKLVIAANLGSQFMPALYEGSSLYMPSALPGISITQASALMQEQDRIIRSFPEVATVFGVVGRSDSATDNAPLDMYDTTIMLKPREQWRLGMTYEELIREMNDKLQFPGLTNTWTMPVQNRLDMELTGIKTAVGMKIQGPDLNRIQEIGAQIQQLLSTLPDTNSVFAERVSQGFYVNVEVNRPEAARYGLTVVDVQRVITSEIGGANIAQNVEGRQRYPIAVRYERDFRDDPAALNRALVPTPTGAQIPINEVARVSSTKRNSACASTKRLIDQGQATRSTLMLLRVIHFMLTSRTPGVRELYRESIFVILRRVGRYEAGKPLARCIDEEQITVRTIIPAQANIRACCLSICRIHLQQRRKRKEA
jgi:Cu(I)/Ag(I) efflux system membrane protein CusA/SilA